MFKKNNKNMQLTDKGLYMLLLIFNCLLLEVTYARGHYIFPDEIDQSSNTFQYNQASSIQKKHWNYPQYVTDLTTKNSVDNKQPPLYNNNFRDQYRYPKENNMKNKLFRFSQPIYPSDLETSNHTIKPIRYKDKNYNLSEDTIDHLPYHIPNAPKIIKHPNTLYNDSLYNGFSSKTDDILLDLDQLFPRAERIRPPF